MSKTPQGIPSQFWQRLTSAWEQQGLPITQMGVAKKLGMSQGSVGKWVNGPGLPVLKTAIEIAEKGKVCVEWLLTGKGPMTPFTHAESDTNHLLEVWKQLNQESRQHVLRTAINELTASNASADFRYAQEPERRGATAIHDRSAAYSRRPRTGR